MDGETAEQLALHAPPLTDPRTRHPLALISSNQPLGHAPAAAVLETAKPVADAGSAGGDGGSENGESGGEETRALQAENDTLRAMLVRTRRETDRELDAKDRVLAALLEEVATLELENGRLRERARVAEASRAELQSTVTELGLMLWAARAAEEDAAASSRALG